MPVCLLPQESEDGFLISKGFVIKKPCGIMIRKLLNISFMIICVQFAGAQYIEEVIEYRPAPGQFINTNSTGTPNAASGITGSDPGMVSLGSVGGYIVFRFDEPVVNHPDHPFGIDFSLFGNPLPEWSEPGLVYVMKDENHNRISDDSWYLLAGSDFFFSTTDRNHRISYYEPEVPLANIPWNNSENTSGHIVHNSFHPQSYYPDNEIFDEFYQDSCSFSLVKIKGNLDPVTSTSIKSFVRAFGSADNRGKNMNGPDYPDNPYTPEQEGYGGDPFDISWAVDAGGNYILLDTVHFIKVQTSMYSGDGVVGEISTELTGGRLTSTDPSISGEYRVLVVEDVPVNPPELSYRMKAYYFENGKYISGTGITWSSEKDGRISREGEIQLNSGMNINIYAHLEGDEEFTSAPYNLRIDEPLYVKEERSDRSVLKIWPNPSRDILNINFSGTGNLFIQNLEGRIIIKENINQGNTALDISGLQPGIYFIYVPGEPGSANKFIKL